MKKGFTLIELLVVIVIIGILSGLITIGMNGAINSANDAKRKINIDTISTGLKIYGTLNSGIFPIQNTQCNVGSNCPNVTSALSELLPVAPTDPKGEFYKYVSDGKYFTVSSSNVSYSNQSGYSNFVCGSPISYAGVTYNTVLIGNQCWFKENLNVGTLTAGVNDQGNSCSSIQKYCYGDIEANCTTDGGLYQWNQAMCGSTNSRAQGICPAGWHIPTEIEWETLELYLGMTQSQIDPSGWRGTDQGSQLSLYTLNGTNSSGFSILLAGYRVNYSSLFYHRGSDGRFWSSSAIGNYKWIRYVYSGFSTVARSCDIVEFGNSIRCLKD